MARRTAPLTAASLIGAGCLNVFLLSNVVAVWSESEASSDERKWSPTLSTAPGAVAAAKPVTSYRYTLSQPVLFKSRQPFVPPPPPPPPAPPKVAAPPPPAIVDPGLVLGGVIITQEVKKAYVFTRSDPKGSWVAEGDKAQGWDVHAIDDARAVLRKEGRTIELLLFPPR